MGVWLGNPDTTILKNGTSSLGSPIIAKVMEFAHKEVYAPENKWKSGDWFAVPNGIQRVGNEVYPSWWSRTQGQANAKLTFDRVSKFKATDCTPAAARIEVDVVKTIDPVTKKEAFSNVPGGYDATKDDNVHNCSDASPTISSIDISGSSGNWTITVNVSQGTFGLDNATASITVNGQALNGNRSGNSFKATYNGTGNPTGGISATVTDSGYYTATGSK
jgi:penicillin-binding protein 1A